MDWRKKDLLRDIERIALGIAILGSIGTAIYRGEVAEALPAGIPEQAAHAARNTLGGALAIAQTLPGELASAMVAVARTAFVDALQLVAAVAAVGAVVTAIAAAAALWRVPARGEPAAEEAMAAVAPSAEGDVAAPGA